MDGAGRTVKRSATKQETELNWQKRGWETSTQRGSQLRKAKTSHLTEKPQPNPRQSGLKQRFLRFPGHLWGW